MSSSPAPCRATAGDRTGRIQACFRTEKRTSKRSRPDQLPRINDHRDTHGGPVPGTRPLPCHSSTGLVLDIALAAAAATTPFTLAQLNRSGAKGDLKELNGWNPRKAHPLRHQRPQHPRLLHLRPHHDRHVMPRLCGPPEASGEPPQKSHKYASRRPGPPPRESHFSGGLSLLRASTIVNAFSRSKLAA